MSGNRTEQPTPRRLEQARRRGEVARSAELSGAGALVLGLAAILATGPGAAARLARALQASLRAAALAPDAGGPIGIAALLDGALLLARVAAPVLVAAAAGGVIASALQTGLLVAPDALRPRLERVDPLRGLRRLLAPAHLAMTALALAKAAILVALLWGWLRDAAASLAQLPRLGPAALLRAPPLLGGLALRLAAAVAILAVLDHALARRRHRKGLMMTRDEVRREAKEDEGDPQHRAERRRLHRAVLEAGPVARATVVVVNPTRLAIAIRHERGAGDAPRVLAKGAGGAAARIRSEARRAGVPIVRDVALARALFRLAEVGEEIPEELYDAAAAILVHLYRQEA